MKAKCSSPDLLTCPSKFTLQINPHKIRSFLSSPMHKYSHVTANSPDPSKQHPALSIDERPMTINSTPTNRILHSYSKTIQNNMNTINGHLSPRRNLSKKSNLSLFDSIIASDQQPTLTMSDMQALSAARDKVAHLSGHPLREL
jgi:hypothetical protein